MNEDIKPWDMEQLRFLAWLHMFPPEARDIMIEVGTQLLETVEPHIKNQDAKQKRDVPIFTTWDLIEHLPIMDRVAAKVAIRHGYIKIKDEK